MTEDQKKQKKKQTGPSLLEWIAAGLGAAIALAILVLIGIEAFRADGSGPPRLDARALSVSGGAGRYLVEIEVRNSGHQTAAGVTVEGELKQASGAVETSTTTLTYVPGGSERRAGLIFTEDPRTSQLQIRATGYEEP